MEDDTRSESSIEYDYIVPRPVSAVEQVSHRRVSIATILLQDEQWVKTIQTVLPSTRKSFCSILDSFQHQLESFIKRFSQCASLSNNLNVGASTTHLLVDDSSHSLRCTLSKKVFQAVARRIFVVSTRWIGECLLHGTLVDEAPFEIQGDSSVSTMHTARRASTMPIFSSVVVFAIECTSFQRTIARHELAELVTLTGGQLLDVKQDSSIDLESKTLLVLADPAADRDHLENKYKQYRCHVKFLTPGFLLKSIIYQKQQPFDDFEI